MTHYDTLGVSQTATPEEITAAYRKIQKQYHPDVYKGSDTEAAQEKVKAANAAYDVLHDPVKKADYDRMLKYGTPFGTQNTGTYGSTGTGYYSGFGTGSSSGQYNPYGQNNTQQQRYYSYGFGNPFFGRRTYYSSNPYSQNNPYAGQENSGKPPRKIGGIGSVLLRFAGFLLVFRLLRLVGFGLPFFFFFF